MSKKLYELVKQGKYTAQDIPQDDEFKNFDRGDLIALIEAQEERIGELLADRPQGEWVEVDDVSISCRCSVCGWEAHLYEDDVYGMPYCPNCGAEMVKNDE